jgi:hypothetical protein
MTDPTDIATRRPIDPQAVQEGVNAARRALDPIYPDHLYLPLVVVLPVHREMIRQARGGNTTADAALRESLMAVIRSIEWPE